MSMKVAISVGGPAVGGHSEWRLLERFATEAEKLGVDCCWSSEGWGQDAIAPLAYLAARTERMKLGTAIMQVSARAPAMTAMTAATLDTISGGRFRLGLGVSGPGVVEGLHGVSFDQPLARLREHLEIVRMALAGHPVRFDGHHYRIPLVPSQKPLAIAVDPGTSVPVYLAALGPRALELTGACADGWLASGFVPEAADSFIGPIRLGAENAGRDFQSLDLVAGGLLAIGAAADQGLAAAKKLLAFRLGAMGPPDKNFYNNSYRRAGFEEEAVAVQRCWLAGDRAGAVRAVPDEMATLTSFVGDDALVRGRVQAFARAGITTLWPEVTGPTVEARLESLEHFLRLVRESDSGPDDYVKYP
jgi:F420-dependent oxidoreductase-like protein